MLIHKVLSHDVRVGVRHAIHPTAMTGTPPPRLDIDTNITIYSVTCQWQENLFFFFSNSLPQLISQTIPCIIYSVCNDTISRGTWPPNFPDLSPHNLCLWELYRHLVTTWFLVAYHNYQTTRSDHKFRNEAEAQNCVHIHLHRVSPLQNAWSISLGLYLLRQHLWCSIQGSNLWHFRYYGI